MRKTLTTLAFSLLTLSYGQVGPIGLPSDRKPILFVDESCLNCSSSLEAALNQKVIIAKKSAFYSENQGKITGEKFELLKTLYNIHTSEKTPLIIAKQNGKSITDIKITDINSAETDIQILNARVESPGDMAALIEPGSSLQGEFKGFTGVIAFWREDCPICHQYREQLNALCKLFPQTVRVLYTRPSSEKLSCQKQYGRDQAITWGIPGTPSFVFVSAGKVSFVNVGYHKNLTKLVELLVVTGGKL